MGHIINPYRFGVSGGDPYWSSVKLLLGFEGADGSTTTSDESSAAHGARSGLGGNAQLDTADFKFGASSLLCDGNGDMFSWSDSADWTLASANSDQFTIELWAKPSSTSLGTGRTFVQHSAVANQLGWRFGISGGTANQLIFSGSTTGNTVANYEWSIGPTAGLTWAVQWYHLAVDKDSTGKVRIYRDGVMVTSGTPANSATFNSSSVLQVGMDLSGGTTSWLGWIDELRITKGIARYKDDAGFAVPTAAFPRF